MKILKKEEGSANSIAFMLVMIFAVMLIAVVTVKVQMVYAAKKMCSMPLRHLSTEHC